MLKRLSSSVLFSNRFPVYISGRYSSIKGTNIDFENVQAAYSNKTNKELIRAILVFTVCNIKPVVKYAETLKNTSEKLIGKTVTTKLIRETFFKHFCAGEDKSEVLPLMQTLNKLGVGGIMDYAAEEDIDDEKPTDPELGKYVEDRQEAREGVISARTYDYVTEEKCDNNMKIMLQCIDMAAETSDTPFAAIKITALGKPAFLARTSELLLRIRSVWADHFDSAQKTVNYDEFANGLIKIGLNLTPEESKELFMSLDSDTDGKIDYIEWTSSIQLEDMATRKILVKSDHIKSLITGNGSIPLLDELETKLMDKLTKRVNTIAAAAYKKNVRLLIDAEQTYLQPMINHICLSLQRKYNRKKPIIYNTYQCYLTHTKQKIGHDIERARREGFYLAAKLVRGAYMEQERKRAKERNEVSPIYNNIQETHNNYNECVSLLLDKIDHVALMLATHNQKSIELAIERMTSEKIKPAYGIYFAQLLGMADHISYPLGKNGYKVFKYVPYGPIDEVIPYLIRRAQENSGVLVNNKGELGMFIKELTRRITSRQKKE